MTLADNAMGSACQDVAQKNVVTVELKISFMRPVFSGTVTARGRVLKKGEHLLFAECHIFNEGGVQVAVALGTYMMVEELKN